MFLFAGVHLSDGLTAEVMHTLVHLFMLELGYAPFFLLGTGSGSLTFSLAASLRPGGRLFTFEFHKQRWQEAR